MINLILSLLATLVFAGSELPPGLDKVPHGTEAFKAVELTLRQNLRGKHFLNPGQHAYPGPKYTSAYLWDTAFISQVWSKVDPEIGKNILEYVLHYQKEDGRVAHSVFDLYFFALPVGKNSQPPVLAWSAWRLQEREPDLKFIARIYPKLIHYHEWFRANRRHSTGLYFWADAYESGIDNSPRFSDASESVLVDTKNLLSTDVTTYVVMTLEALEKMANALGLPLDAARFAAERQDLIFLTNKMLWDERDGLYYDWNLKNAEFIRVNTIASLLPLVAGIPNAAQAERLMGHIRNPEEYNTPTPLPSVARNDPTFEKDMWRGPVWVNTAYLTLLGMDRYGYHNETVSMSKNLVRGVYATWVNCGSFYEFYDTERDDLVELHRKRGNWWKEHTLGKKPVSHFVGWTGLVNNLVWEFGKEW